MGYPQWVCRYPGSGLVAKVTDQTSSATYNRRQGHGQEELYSEWMRCESCLPDWRVFVVLVACRGRREGTCLSVSKSRWDGGSAPNLTIPPKGSPAWSTFVLLKIEIQRGPCPFDLQHACPRPHYFFGLRLELEKYIRQVSTP